MTDLDKLKFFLGLEVVYSGKDIFISQSKYTRDLLSHFGMTSAKSCSTSLALKDSHVDASLCSSEDAYKTIYYVRAVHLNKTIYIYIY